MEKISEFLANYCGIFVLISIFLILALVGFFVSVKKGKQIQFKIDNSVNENIINPTAYDNKSLQEMVKQNADIKKNEDELL
ncbi:hypothetical protein EGR52_11500 [bacterium]|nr:hypothetical protein [bacterium]